MEGGAVDQRALLAAAVNSWERLDGRAKMTCFLLFDGRQGHSSLANRLESARQQELMHIRDAEVAAGRGLPVSLTTDEQPSAVGAGGEDDEQLYHYYVLHDTGSMSAVPGVQSNGSVGGDVAPESSGAALPPGSSAARVTVEGLDDSSDDDGNDWDDGADSDSRYPPMLLRSSSSHPVMVSRCHFGRACVGSIDSEDSNREDRPECDYGDEESSTDSSNEGGHGEHRDDDGGYNSNDNSGDSDDGGGGHRRRDSEVVRQRVLRNLGLPADYAVGDGTLQGGVLRVKPRDVVLSDGRQAYSQFVVSSGEDSGDDGGGGRDEVLE